MTQIFKRLGISFLVLTVLFGGGIFATSLMNPTAVSASTESNKNSISVTGKGTIKVSPDTAYVTLGVRTENKDAKLAQEENTKKMNQVIIAIRGLGVQEKEIKTSGFSMYPQYIYDRETYTQTGIDRYIVEHTLEITVKDIDNVGKIIDAAIGQGVNISHSIRFTVSNAEEIYEQAIVEAVKNAQGKATVIANTLGAKIGKPKNVTEQSSYYAPAYYNAYEKTMMDTAAGMQVQQGELEISATISAVYEY